MATRGRKAEPFTVHFWDSNETEQVFTVNGITRARQMAEGKIIQMNDVQRSEIRKNDVPVHCYELVTETIVITKFREVDLEEEEQDS